MSRIDAATFGTPAGQPFGAISFPLDQLDRIRLSRAFPDEAAIARLNVAKVSTGLDLIDRLERARRHLHANPGRTVSLRELGAVATLSTFHLARFFKLAFGTAPIAYHRALRLDRAAALLASGTPSVAKVAELAGYSDAVAFTHAFRKHFGISPRRLIAWAQPFATIYDRS